MGYILPFLVMALVSCATPDSPAKAKGHVTNMRENKAAPVDTLYKEYIFDTSIVFNSSASLNEYWKALQQKTFAAGKSLKNAKGNALTAIELDAIIYKNSALLGYGVMKYFRTHEKRPDEIFMLNVLASVQSTLYSYEDVMRLYRSFPIAAQQSGAGKSLLQNLQEHYQRTGVPLNKLAAFSLQDPKGGTVKFNDLLLGDYDYYLLVFGASWCKPCRLENHFLKQHLSYFEEMRIKLIGISMDTDIGAWKRAIQEDGCSWPQYIDKMAFESGFAKAGGITGVPDNLLYAKNGELVFRSRDIEQVLQKVNER